MFKLDGDALAAAPAFRKETLAEPNNTKSRQAAAPCTCTRTAVSYTA